MKIKQISVTGLFGIFDHVIPLNDERITIVHSPNGFGKTAMLRLLNGLFNSQYSVLWKIPFKSFRVNFSNDSSVEIVKESNNNLKESEQKADNVILSFYEPNSKSVSFFIDQVSFLIDQIEDYSNLETVSDLPIVRQLLQDKPTEITSDYADYAYVKGYISTLRKLKDFDEEPDWLKDLRDDTHVHLIESQRLLNFASKNSSKSNLAVPSIPSTVSAYSDQIAQLMREKFIEYGVIAQSLDRTFPSRLVKSQISLDLTDKQLHDQLDELEANRSHLIEVGLLDKNENSDFQIPSSIDENTKNILSVYVHDMKEKFSVFKEIASKIELLKKIVNHKFSYKEINFSKENGFVFKTLCENYSASSETLTPNNLSSGEQHELVLLYELLFKVKPGALVLIDEPELSLHVGWQVQFLKDLQEITKLADIDILMATHSPDIIQDRWDLTVELKGLEK
jgi:predicted ATP-binding protein involved in virulence